MRWRLSFLQFEFGNAADHKTRMFEVFSHACFLNDFGPFIFIQILPRAWGMHAGTAPMRRQRSRRAANRHILESSIIFRLPVLRVSIPWYVGVVALPGMRAAHGVHVRHCTASCVRQWQ